jgi:hypothetical protein
MASSFLSKIFSGYRNIKLTIITFKSVCVNDNECKKARALKDYLAIDYIYFNTNPNS